MEIFWLSDFLLERKINKAGKKFERTRKRPEWVEFTKLIQLKAWRKTQRDMKRHSGLNGGANT